VDPGVLAAWIGAGLGFLGVIATEVVQINATRDVQHEVSKTVHRTNYETLGATYEGLAQDVDNINSVEKHFKYLCKTAPAKIQITPNMKLSDKNRILAISSMKFEDRASVVTALRTIQQFNTELANHFFDNTNAKAVKISCKDADVAMLRTLPPIERARDLLKNTILDVPAP
jgi:hypothetical protein